MKNWNLSLITLLIVFTIASCVKENFDEPPQEEDHDPEIETNASISDITDMWVEGEFTTIEEDLTIDAVVIADDQSGNYYKTIVIQDETGGVELKINTVGIFNDFPIGRKIYLHCKDLIISDFSGLIQLGGNTYTDDGELRLGGIEEALIDKYIVKGPRNQSIQPKVSSISELGRDDLSTLIQLNDVQFVPGDTSMTYADAVAQFSVNLDLENCDGNSIVLRSSGFADFADENVPNGNGTITAVYSVFNNTKQLFIRNTEDVDFTGNRCGVTGGGECDDITGNRMNIEEVRNTFMGSQTTLPSGSYIEGVVISDADNNNIHGRNVVLQGDDGYGVLVRFSDFHNYQLNDRLKVDVSNSELSEFQGLLQVNDVALSNACKDGSGSVSPRVITISEILNNFEDLESTLVQIDNVTISKDSGDDWVYSVTLNDGTGQIDMFTYTSAPWANQSFPTDSVRITAYVSQGGSEESMQVTIRNLDDVVVIGGGGGGNEEGIDEDFQSGANYDEVNLQDWTNVAVEGNRRWIYREFDGNLYAQSTSFNSGESNETWLVTPEINTGETNILSFESAMEYYDHDGLTVFVSSDFTSDVTTATWQELSEAEIAGETNENHEWVFSGEIDLSPYGQSVHVAFRYIGTDPNEATSYRIDNVKVVAP